MSGLSARGGRAARLCALLIAVSLSPAASARNLALKVGDDPPDILGKTAAGNKVKLEDYRGRVVVISFWASWCPPCRKELPMLIALQKAATSARLVVLSVNWGQSYDEFRKITKAMRDTEITLISDSSGSTGEAYGVKAIPHMIIVGRDGKIAAIHVGYSEQKIPALLAEINSLLLNGTRPASEDTGAS